MNKAVHIIAFAVPYPPNYGGVIDVYHKLRCLKAAGVRIFLHTYVYGKHQPAPELEALCEKVYYYKRASGLRYALSRLPYTVSTRQNEQLVENILQHEAPVLCEVLHTCFLLSDQRLSHYRRYYRHSNIEHVYYRHLAKAERSFGKKLYLWMEALRLKAFEPIVKKADAIFAVSQEDTLYFQQEYPQVESLYLPSFHANDRLEVQAGKGNYILYQGNLSISENYKAAEWLVRNVFSKIEHPVIIAGLQPPEHLTALIRPYDHIELLANCSEVRMQELIRDAHIHCLYTAQGTGLKLKLLNVLFKGRYVLLNDHMLNGTALDQACIRANSGQEFIQEINRLMALPFHAEELKNRDAVLTPFYNSTNTEKLIKKIF